MHDVDKANEPDMLQLIESTFWWRISGAIVLVLFGMAFFIKDHLLSACCCAVLLVIFRMDAAAIIVPRTFAVWVVFMVFQMWQRQRDAIANIPLLKEKRVRELRLLDEIDLIPDGMISRREKQTEVIALRNEVNEGLRRLPINLLTETNQFLLDIVLNHQPEVIALNNGVAEGEGDPSDIELHLRHGITSSPKIQSVNMLNPVTDLTRTFFCRTAF